MSSPVKDAIGCLRLASVLNAAHNVKETMLPWHARMLLGVPKGGMDEAVQGSSEQLMMDMVAAWYAGTSSPSLPESLTFLSALAPNVPQVHQAAINALKTCSASAHDANLFIEALWTAVMGAHGQGASGSIKAEEANASAYPHLWEHAKVLENAGEILLQYCVGVSDGGHEGCPAGVTSCIGQLSFCAAVTLRCIRLLSFVHFACLTGHDIHPFVCINALKCTHGLIRLSANSLLEWERCAKLPPEDQLFPPGAVLHASTHAETLSILFDRKRMPVMSRVVRIFFALRARCCLMFYDSVDHMLPGAAGVGASQDSGSTRASVENLDSLESTWDGTAAAAASRLRHSTTRESPSAVGSRANTLENDRAITRSASSSSIQTPTVTTSPSTKLGVAARLFGLVRRGGGGHAHGEAATAQAPTTRSVTKKKEVAPLTTVPQASRIARQWKETAVGLHITRCLAECGAAPLGDSIAAFQMLRCRPGVASVAFLLMSDNGNRQGTICWKDHRFQTIPCRRPDEGTATAAAATSSPHRSSMQSWTLCFCTEPIHSASSATSVKQSWRLFESFVFLAADSEKQMLESSSSTRHLFVYRITGYDQDNMFACLAVEHNRFGGQHVVAPPSMVLHSKGAADEVQDSYGASDLCLDAKKLLEAFVELWRHPCDANQ